MSLSILHTADWHLGMRTGGQERLDDQLARIEQVIAYCDQHQVDVLLVCGDVLEDPRPARLSTAVAHLAELLGPELERGMQCVFLAGNHDSVHTFELLDGVQRLLGPQAQGQVRFVPKPALVELTSNEQPQAALIALPYPTPSAYPTSGTATDVVAKQAQLREAMSAQADALLREAEQTMPELPRVMAGHFLVSDIPAMTGSREVSEGEDVRVDSARLDEFAYVALGHVHKPDLVSERVRYSGALDRIDFGEADEPRQVLLVELSDSAAAEVTALPLEATPMQQFEIGALAEITQAAETVADLERTLVKLTLRVPSGESVSAWTAEAKSCFPRLFQPLDIRMMDDPLPSLVTSGLEGMDTAQTLRGYLEDELDGDPDREDLLQLADDLLAEESEHSL